MASLNEHPVGSKNMIDGVELITFLRPIQTCGPCYFETMDGCCRRPCMASERQDGTDVLFATEEAYVLARLKGEI